MIGEQTLRSPGEIVLVVGYGKWVAGPGARPELALENY